MGVYHLLSVRRLLRLLRLLRLFLLFLRFLRLVLRFLRLLRRRAPPVAGGGVGGTGIAPGLWFWYAIWFSYACWAYEFAGPWKLGTTKFSVYHWGLSMAAGSSSGVKSMLGIERGAIPPRCLRERRCLRLRRPPIWLPYLPINWGSSANDWSRMVVRAELCMSWGSISLNWLGYWACAS